MEGASLGASARLNSKPNRCPLTIAKRSEQLAKPSQRARVHCMALKIRRLPPHFKVTAGRRSVSSGGARAVNAHAYTRGARHLLRARPLPAPRLRRPRAPRPRAHPRRPAGAGPYPRGSHGRSCAATAAAESTLTVSRLLSVARADRLDADRPWIGRGASNHSVCNCLLPKIMAEIINDMRWSIPAST